MSGRVTNMLLCLMKISNPLLTMYVLVVTNIQEPKVSMIIKTYVTMGMITELENQAMFSQTFTSYFTDIVDNLNET